MTSLLQRMLLVSIVLVVATTTGWAQDDGDEFEGKTVTEIEFIGADRAYESVEALVKTKIGQPLKRAVLNEDIKALVEKHRVFDGALSVRFVPWQDGVKIQFFVTENPRIDDIVFLGNYEKSRKELLELIDSRPGGLANEITIKLDERRIIDEYKNLGFHFFQLETTKIVDKFTTVVFKMTEGDKVGIEKVTFVGNKTFDKDDLLDAMPSADENGFFSDHPYVEKDIERDLVALERFYAAKGFLDASIALQDRSFSLDKKKCFLTIRINERTPYIVKSLRIEGMTQFDPAEILAGIDTKIGDRFENGFKLSTDRERIKRKYYDQAFIDAIVGDDSILPEEGYEVDVVIIVVEGDRAKVGDVRIEGNVETRDKVIRRLLEDLAPGRPLNLNTLNRAQARIINLRYFDPSSVEVFQLEMGLTQFETYRDVFVTVEDTEKKSVKDIVVRLEEVDTGSIRFAVGVNSNAGLVGAIVYRKDNFDPTDLPESFDDILDAFTGGGQALEIGFFPGFIQTQAYIRYSHPFVFDSDYGFSAEVYHRLRLRENHDETATGTQIGISRQFDFNLSAFMRYRLERIVVDDIDNDAGQIVFDFEGTNLISSIILGVRIADLDNFQSPGEGYRLNITYERAGLGGDIAFNRFDINAEYYLTLHEDAEGRRHILFAKGRFGYVKETQGVRDVPIFERFFAGGQNSIRGFAFRGVGPMSNGSPDGGKALIVGSLNYQFPIYEQILGGVVFIDTGTLAPEIDSEELTDFRVTAGFGIRLRIDFISQQPFAIDIGFPLLKQDSDDTQLISFSIDRQF